MSASERLRELDEVVREGIDPGHPSVWTAAIQQVERALPLIADLVEAAERTIQANDSAGTIYLHGKSLLPSLAALRDALEEK